jgi:hypothetical protein
LAALWQGVKDIATSFDEHRDDVARYGRALKARAGDPNDPWRWLLHRVDSFTGMSIIAALELEKVWSVDSLRRGSTVSLLLADAVTTPALLNSVREGLDATPLPTVRRDQLVAGVEYVEAERDHLAVPLLISAIEGLFWREAEDAELIRRTGQGKWKTTLKSGSIQEIGSIKPVMAALRGHVDEAFRQYVVHVVYDRAGQALRHGNAHEGWKLRSALLMTVLVGWLGHRSVADDSGVLRRAFLDRRDRSDDEGVLAS